MSSNSDGNIEPFEFQPESTISINKVTQSLDVNGYRFKDSSSDEISSNDEKNDFSIHHILGIASSRSNFAKDVSSSVNNSVLTKDFYKTIVFMDHRRLRRRFSGIRKPISYKKLGIICIYCVILACLPLTYFEMRDNEYIFGLKIERGATPLLSFLGFVLLTYINFSFQLKQAVKWPIIISYISICVMSIGMLISRFYESLRAIAHSVLMFYTFIQIPVLVTIYIVVSICPLLALKGFLFPCADHFRILNCLFENNKLLVIISRYNDYSLMCGGPVCGLPRCLYQSLYRLISRCCRRMKKLVSHNSTGYSEAPFSHQMRYQGKVDDRGRPHGYGEWLEDNPFGERLKGYWWHGYPIGPFSSQEIGSGSIFANTRVAFVTNTKSDGNVKFGVACTECSISGHFFRYFPVTYFFHPKIIKESAHGNFFTRSLYKNNFFRLMQPTFDYNSSGTIEWCFKMLKSQFWLNMPKRITSCTINVDKWSGLRIEGFLPKPDNFGPKLKLGRVKSLSGKPLMAFNKFSQDTREKIVFHASFKGAKKRGEESNRAFKNSFKTPLFVDEDEWANMNKNCPTISADGWLPIRSLAKYGKVAHEAIIFVHGYNLTLSQACAQLSHFISFSKLPPYIMPFLFHWPGKYWGPLSPFAYPVAKKVSESTSVGNSMPIFLRELQKMGIVRVHFLAHSCGARTFFNGLHSCIAQGMFRKVVVSDFTTSERITGIGLPEKMLLQSCILLNPDYSLDNFVKSDFFALRTYCSSIVIYADTRDQCLTMSSIWNREQLVGKSIFCLTTTSMALDKLIADRQLAKSYTLYPELLESQSVFSRGASCSDVISGRNHDSNSISNGDAANGETGHNNGAHCDNTNKNDGKDDRGIGSRVPKFIWLNPEKGNGRCRPSWKGINEHRQQKGVVCETARAFFSDKNAVFWLDLDVVDMSTIDSNVDFLKHSSYQMKREIMDDIREVVLLGNRAEDRKYRLDRRRGNVHVLRIAPAAISQLLGD